MKILILGGTKFIGIHLVNKLLAQGHTVTIATRGKANDPFGNRVHRLILERTCPESIAQALTGKTYDVVYDSQAYSSYEVKYLLDVVKCKRYIETSTVSVYYPNFTLDLKEPDFDPTSHPLKWCKRDDFGYDEIKRQGECAMFQVYGHVPSVAVRFPLVIGEDDYTQRLHFYVDHVVNGKPMHIDNLDAVLTFIMSDTAGDFLAWLVDKDFCGSVNAANVGTVSLGEVIAYVEEKCNTKAIIQANGAPAPFNGFPSYGLNLDKATDAGYVFEPLYAPLYRLLDSYIASFNFS